MKVLRFRVGHHEFSFVVGASRQKLTDEEMKIKRRNRNHSLDEKRKNAYHTYSCFKGKCRGCNVPYCKVRELKASVTENDIRRWRKKNRRSTQQ